MTNWNREAKIQELKAAGNDWDTLTARLMEQDANLSQGRASTRAYKALQIQQHADHLAQIERDEAAPAQPHWGSDPRMAGLVGLD
jgi:hypothetical protein